MTPKEFIEEMKKTVQPGNDIYPGIHLMGEILRNYGYGKGYQIFIDGIENKFEQEKQT